MNFSIYRNPHIVIYSGTPTELASFGLSMVERPFKKYMKWCVGFAPYKLIFKVPAKDFTFDINKANEVIPTLKISPGFVEFELFLPGFSINKAASWTLDKPLKIRKGNPL